MGSDGPEAALPDSVLDQVGPLIETLLAEGWRVIAPVERGGGIHYAEIGGPADLPRGRTDSQEAGRYRLEDGDPERWFDYVVGPQSWKAWLFPARRRLWSAARTADGFSLQQEDAAWPRTAFVGVRACEIAAMGVQDRVFDNGQFTDPDYTRRRAETLIVAVQCARSAGTCFCASMNTGPRATSGFDLALTELDGRFVLEIGSDRGAAIAARLPTRPATEPDRVAARAASARAAAMQTRRMPPGIAPALRNSPEHPHWDEVASRCLSCGNCTLACPTCFCSDVEDVTDLAGEHAERWRSWDSCFSVEFSHMHGGATRRSTTSRYRQWMTHKLSSWVDQFGSSGCVGCGRCIAWCPVGIDITREALVFAKEEG